METEASPCDFLAEFASSVFSGLAAPFALSTVPRAQAALAAQASELARPGALTSAELFRQVLRFEAERLLAEGLEIKYTADVMCPAEYGLAVNVAGGVVSAISGNP